VQDEWTASSLPNLRDAGFPPSGLKSPRRWFEASSLGSGTSPGRFQSADVITSSSCLSCRFQSSRFSLVERRFLALGGLPMGYEVQTLQSK